MHNNFVSFIDWFYANTDFKNEPNKIGRPRYSDDKLLKVVILGFSEGITSGRKIEVNLIFDDRYKTLQCCQLTDFLMWNFYSFIF